MVDAIYEDTHLPPLVIVKRGPTTEGETRMRYVFARPDDANREIILTVMAIPMPVD
jgi:hypothetical protein